MSRTVFFFTVLFLLGLLWGASIPLTKIAVSSGHAPLGMVFWQLLVATVVLGIAALVRGSRLVIDRRHLFFFATVTIIGTIIPNSFSYMAASRLPASVMALVIALVPIFSLLVALVMRVERFAPRRAIGVVLGATAIAMLVLPQGSLPDPAKAGWVLIALIAPFCYGMEGNYVATATPKGTGPVATLLGASITGLFLVTPMVIATDAYIDPMAGFGKVELALLAVCLMHAAGYLTYIWMVGAAGPVFTAQVAYLVTPSGVLMSMVLLGEVPSPWLWAALALLLVGLFLVQPKPETVVVPEV
ncbi:DMT family transporter [Ahrensia sp. R2A130]|uniref:DMT family transporter n=1 Tax=Ahrensia sp. R2A130 TaxID=744979 RepID=UPI0001E0F875|nr:EamA family transporter [Ahrensia sp. R2A130]EFL89194.1 putative integral membrane protein [Ahrensia sp. R2A130]